MESKDKCPRCAGTLERDEVDIGVGTSYGPAGCPACYWTEDPLASLTSASDAPTGDVLEYLADLEHTRWSALSTYESVLTEGMARKPEDTETFRERWERLRKTPYAALTEAEKDIVRIEARKTFAKGIAARVDDLLQSNNDLLQRARDAEAREQQLLQSFHFFALSMQGGKYTHKEKGGTYFAVRCKGKIPGQPITGAGSGPAYMPAPQWVDGFVYVSAHSGELFWRDAGGFKKAMTQVAP